MPSRIVQISTTVVKDRVTLYVLTEDGKVYHRGESGSLGSPWTRVPHPTETSAIREPAKLNQEAGGAE